ncbi:MAG: methionine adenosyltransferase [Armatimonadetes bacterium]|nr:methionine adenosyltransferase [Armatimonadota bacterium]
MRNITVDVLSRTPVARHKVEIVERKGIGHPDSICDAIMERVSIALSREYLQRFGRILHHNIDKAFLVAGNAEIRLGGGIVTEPMRLIFGDRATAVANGEEIPVEEIAVDTAKVWIRENLRFVDSEKHVGYDVQIKPGAPELVDIFQREGAPVANDTSAAVGYAPLTPTEQAVLDIERMMNSRTFKEHFPEVGEDIKVMGFRKGDELHLTAAVAFVDRFIDSEATYIRRKAELHSAVSDRLATIQSFTRAQLYLNTLDEPGRGIGGMYLTVTGTSAESGDSGQVGRGNKVNGVIALNRPMGTEAAAGKNPVSHVGKIYTILTHQVANKIYHDVPGIDEVYVWLLSQIGSPVDQPKVAAAQLVLARHARRSAVERRVREILDYELANIRQLSQDLAEGRYPVC